MRTGSWILVALAAAMTAACEMDDVNVNDFLNDMTVDQNGDDTPVEAVCGDGRLDDGEQCDDGNGWDGDGCSSWCTIEMSGCYDEYGYYRYPGEEWSYDENSACYCVGYGQIDCWGWDDPEEGCYVEGQYYEIGDFIYLEGWEDCMCVEYETVQCGGIAII